MAWRAQLSRNLKELRILFSPSSPSSSSTRFSLFDIHSNFGIAIFIVSIMFSFSFVFVQISYGRAFIENNYKDLKTKNPKLPILIREATGIEPQLWARYGNLLIFHSQIPIFFVERF